MFMLNSFQTTLFIGKLNSRGGKNEKHIMKRRVKPQQELTSKALHRGLLALVVACIWNISSGLSIYTLKSNCVRSSYRRSRSLFLDRPKCGPRPLTMATRESAVTNATATLFETE